MGLLAKGAGAELIGHDGNNSLHMAIEVRLLYISQQLCHHLLVVVNYCLLLEGLWYESVSVLSCSLVSLEITIRTSEICGIFPIYTCRRDEEIKDLM